MRYVINRKENDILNVLLYSDEPFYYCTVLFNNNKHITHDATTNCEINLSHYENAHILQFKERISYKASSCSKKVITFLSHSYR